MDIRWRDGAACKGTVAVVRSRRYGGVEAHMGMKPMIRGLGCALRMGRGNDQIATGGFRGCVAGLLDWLP